MAKNSMDIEQMLDSLGLGEMSMRLDALVRSPEGMDLSPLQLLREIVTAQYTLHRNEQFRTNLRLSRLRQQEALLENLHTGNGRVFNDNLAGQLKTLEFVDDRKNVTVVGESSAGKTYFLRAFCIEACKRNYRTLFIDYMDLMDELIARKQKDLENFKKRLRYYSRIQVLMIDDFLIAKYSSESLDNLYSLIKERAILGKTTMVSTQFGPDEWDTCMSNDIGVYAKCDGIRSRLIENGYFVVVEKAR